MKSFGQKSKDCIRRETGLSEKLMRFLTTPQMGFYFKHKNSIDVEENEGNISFTLKNRFLILDYFIRSKEFDFNSLRRSELFLDENSFDNYLYKKDQGFAYDLVYSDLC